MKFKNEKKKLKCLAKGIILWAVCMGYESASAFQPLDRGNSSNGFFSKKKEFPIHFGLKGGVKPTFVLLDQNWAAGVEFPVGLFVEWKLLNGIGIQTGIWYSYNLLGSVSLAVQGEPVGFSNFNTLKDRAVEATRQAVDNIEVKSDDDSTSLLDGSFNKITFHAVSIPFSLRIYLEKTRQLVLYGGPRLVIKLKGQAKQIGSIFVKNKNLIRRDLVEKGLASVNANTLLYDNSVVEKAMNAVGEIINACLKHTSTEGKEESLEFKGKRFHWNADIGFEFNGKNGFLLGMNTMGITIGYNFSALFTPAEA